MNLKYSLYNQQVEHSKPVRHKQLRKALFLVFIFSS